jgi:hypothetical protein
LIASMPSAKHHFACEVLTRTRHAGFLTS